MWEQEMGMNEFQGENFEFGELPGEFTGEMEAEYAGELSGEFVGETGYEVMGESPLSEMQEMELAAELLSVTNEAELNQFLGGLIKKASGFIKSPVGRALGGILKGVAKTALPIVGGAIGSFVAPGVGTAIGSSLGSAAGKLFGLELEGLSNEDREFEVARRVVRLGAVAARHAAAAPRHIPPQHVARRAVTIAARRHAPGLLVRPTMAPHRHHARSAPGWVGPRYRPVQPTYYPTSYPVAYPTAAAVPQAVAQAAPQVVAQSSFAGAPMPTPDPYAAAAPYQVPYWGTYQDAVQSGRWIRRGRNIIILGV